MILRYYIVYCLLFILMSCNKNKIPDESRIVSSLREMQELTTVEYTITKVVKASDNKTWFKAGQRKILITSEATVKAGIDLSSISENDIVTDGKSITIYLPPPTIVSVNIPPEKIKVEFERIGLFRDPFTGAERDQLMVQAEQQIRKSGEELGILDQAKVNTQLFFSGFLLQSGFEKVFLRYDKPAIKL